VSCETAFSDAGITEKALSSAALRAQTFERISEPEPNAPASGSAACWPLRDGPEASAFGSQRAVFEI